MQLYLRDAAPSSFIPSQSYFQDSILPQAASALRENSITAHNCCPAWRPSYDLSALTTAGRPYRREQDGCCT
jgi:hypothetical protein